MDWKFDDTLRAFRATSSNGFGHANCPGKRLGKKYKSMNMKGKGENKNLTTLEEFKENNYGKRGTKKRDELEVGYENFKIGALNQDRNTPYSILE